MKTEKPLPQKFYDVLKHDGVVSIVSWGRERTAPGKHLELIPRSYGG